MTKGLPRAALDDRLAFVGTAGSGKTYAAGTGVERLLSTKARVVTIDPLGVWWGLRLNADGKSPSPFNVVIFGGQHGDLPLSERAGALVGETVAGTSQSCVIDLSQIGTKAGERRFMLGFLTALYRNVTGDPLHLVVDEADMFAPQKLLDKEGEAAKLLGMMETIVRRGRIKGFIPWLITQRPAVLSKDVLSQADGLIALKLTSSQDRAAIGAWIEGQADQQEGKAIIASLPAMERGHGVVWVPGRGLLERTHFPTKVTYDSSKTPKRGERLKSATLTPLDLGAMKEKLASVEKEAKENDPKALRAEIVKLQSEIGPLRKNMEAKSHISQNAASTRKEVEAARKADAAKISSLRKALEATMKFILKISVIGFDEDKKMMESAVAQAVEAINSKIDGHIAKREKNLQSLKTEGDRIISSIQKMLDEEVTTEVQITRNEPFSISNPTSPAVSRQRASAPAPIPKPLSAASGDGDYTGPQRKVLASLMFWRSVGADSPSRDQVAAVAGYSPGSGNFNNLLGGLKATGAIDYPAQGQVCITFDYTEVPSAQDAKETLLNKVLGGPHRKILVAMNTLPSPATRDQIAEASEYSAGSGNFNNLLGKLRTLSVIDYPGQGLAEITGWAKQLLEA